jgi:iron only hydrogenase large subunit-like protein
LKESGSDFAVKAISCDGIEECRAALLRAQKGVLPYNFIEGMACRGGCIGGAGCITHEQKGRQAADRHSREATAKSIEEALAASPLKENE